MWWVKNLFLLCFFSFGSLYALAAATVVASDDSLTSETPCPARVFALETKPPEELKDEALDVDQVALPPSVAVAVDLALNTSSSGTPATVLANPLMLLRAPTEGEAPMPRASIGSVVLTGHPKDHLERGRAQRVLEMVSRPAASIELTVVVNPLREEAKSREEKASELKDVSSIGAHPYSTYNIELEEVQKFIENYKSGFGSDSCLGLWSNIPVATFKLLANSLCSVVPAVVGDYFSRRKHYITNCLSITFELFDRYDCIRDAGLCVCGVPLLTAYLLVPLFVYSSQAVATVMRSNKCDDICSYILPSQGRNALFITWGIMQAWSAIVKYRDFLRYDGIEELKAFKNPRRYKATRTFNVLASLALAASDTYIFESVLGSQANPAGVVILAIGAYIHSFIANYISLSSLTDRVYTYTSKGRTKEIRKKRDTLIRKALGNTSNSWRPHITKGLGVSLAALGSYVGYSIGEHAFQGIYLYLSKGSFTGYDNIDSELSSVANTVGPSIFGYIGGVIGGVTGFALSAMKTSDFLDQITGDICLLDTTRKRLGQHGIGRNLCNTLFSSLSSYVSSLPAVINGYIALKRHGDFTPFMKAALAAYGITKFAGSFNEAMDDNSATAVGANNLCATWGDGDDMDDGDPSRALLLSEKEAYIYAHTKDEFIVAYDIAK